MDSLGVKNLTFQSSTVWEFFRSRNIVTRLLLVPMPFNTKSLNSSVAKSTYRFGFGSRNVPIVNIWLQYVLSTIVMTSFGDY